jgi:hypothetical protein
VIHPVGQPNPNQLTAKDAKDAKDAKSGKNGIEKNSRSMDMV